MVGADSKNNWQIFASKVQEMRVAYPVTIKRIDQSLSSLGMWFGFLAIHEF
jgi:hypothetical protein